MILDHSCVLLLAFCREENKAKGSSDLSSRFLSRVRCFPVYYYYRRASGFAMRVLGFAERFLHRFRYFLRLTRTL
jgi:hypothetical protein